MKLSRIRKLIFLHLQHLPMKSRGQRATICKLGGGTNLQSIKNVYRGRCHF